MKQDQFKVRLRPVLRNNCIEWDDDASDEEVGSMGRLEEGKAKCQKANDSICEPAAAIRGPVDAGSAGVDDVEDEERAGGEMNDDFDDDDDVIFSQPSLCAAILLYLDRCKIAGVNNRQMNTIIRCATEIYLEMQKPTVAAEAGSGLAKWLASDDTGASSKFMAHVLSESAKYPVSWYGAGGIPKPAPPLDPEDFGRCVRMLDAAPELRQHISAMASHGPVWEALSKRWNELESLYRQESPSGLAPMLYREIRGIVEKGK